MRRILGSICTLALLAPVPASPQPAEPKAQVDDGGTGFCRRPTRLPSLAPEAEAPPPRQRRARLGSVAGGGVDLDEAEESPIVVTAARREDARPSRRTRDEAMAVAAPPPPAPPPPAAEAPMPSAAPSMPRIAPGTSPAIRPLQPQAGLLTAGEHDDLLNPELYAEYVRSSGLGQHIRDLPVLDTSRLLTVTLRDDRGQPVPFASIEVHCSDGNAITLRTMADGSAVFFPGFDRLSDTVTIRAAGGDPREVRIAAGAGSQEIGFTTRLRSGPITELDLAVALDVTGSMGDEISFLQAELRSIIRQIAQRHPQLDIRIGFVFYRDRGDDFITRTIPFETDQNTVDSYLASQRADGGGDTPEAVQDALHRAVGLSWRNNAVKTLLLVADAPPHDQDMAASWLAVEHLRARRVHIVPVGASGVEARAEYLMRAMAAATQSRYTFLTDDSGIGNAHAAPAIDCYLVTRLDQLLRRVIDSQISGRRIEPDDQEVIRRVGEYDAGRCILPPDYPNQGSKRGA